MRIGRSRSATRRATLFVLAVITTVLTPLAEGAPTTGFLGAPAVRPPSPTSTAQRTVVMEAFTGTWCPPCVDASLAMKQLESDYPRSQLAIVEYHFGEGGMSDPFEPKDGTSQERYAYYGGQSNVGAPGVVFDGDHANVINGASSVPEAKAKYKARIDAHLTAPSPVEVVAVATYSGLAASFSFTANPVGQMNRTDVVLRAALVEDISATHQGHWIGWVARATVMTESRSLTQSASATSTFTLDPSWKPDRLAVLAYVQDPVDKSILQGGFSALKAGNVSDTKPPVIASVSHSPPSPTELEKVRVGADITDDTVVASASVRYDAGSGPVTRVLSSAGPRYSADIGPFPAGATVIYRIEARDPAGNTAASPDASFKVVKAPQADTTPPVLSAPAVSPASPAEGTPVTISSTVTDDIAVASVDLSFTDSAGPHSAPMAPQAGDRYSATIGPFTAGESVTAAVRAKDTSGNLATSSSVTFKVLQDTAEADLELSAASVSLSSPSPTAGEASTVTITLSNRGPSTATRVVVRLDAGGVRLGDVLIESIPSGSNAVASLKWTPSKPGRVELVATADPGAVQPDPDRANNVATIQVDVKERSGTGWLAGADWPTIAFLLLLILGVAVSVGAVASIRRRRRDRRAGYDPGYPLRFG